MRIDTILYSDIIYLNNGEFTAGYILIKDKIIVDLLPATADISAYCRQPTLFFDFTGRPILPGFIDCHVHLFFSALSLVSVNLSETESEEEAAWQTKIWAEEQKKNTTEWVIGFGWGEYNWKNKQLPTKASLDRLLPDRPVCLFNQELHGAWVNSKALELCGISAGTIDPTYGQIAKDGHGEPTGYLLETAMEQVAQIVANRLSEGLRVNVIRDFLKHAAKNGITAISDTEIYGVCFHRDYAQIEQKDELNTRVFFSVPLEDDFHYYKELDKEYGSDMLRFSGLGEEFIDGTPLAHTALMVEPYSDLPSSYGSSRVDLKLLEHRIITADKENLRVRLHACGDGAVRAGLDILEKARKENGARDSRHTIEHIECLHPADLHRFAALNVIPSMQPTHMAALTEDTNLYPVILGEERCRYAWPFKSLFQSKVAFGTDCPIVTLNPFRSLFHAITRVNWDLKPIGGWIPEEKISVSEAVDAYTMHAAYLNFAEQKIGRVKKGLFADLIVLDRNIFKIIPEKILETKVLLTMVGGRIVYSDGQ